MWHAAFRLFNFFEEMWDEVLKLGSLPRSGLQVLELGAGCGWLGMALALNLHPYIEVLFFSAVFSPTLSLPFCWALMKYLETLHDRASGGRSPQLAPV